MTADVVSGQSVFVLDKDQNLEDVHTRCLPPSRLVIYTSRRTRHAGPKQAPTGVSIPAGDLQGQAAS